MENACCYIYFLRNFCVRAFLQVSHEHVVGAGAGENRNLAVVLVLCRRLHTHPHRYARLRPLHPSFSLPLSLFGTRNHYATPRSGGAPSTRASTTRPTRRWRALWRKAWRWSNRQVVEDVFDPSRYPRDPPDASLRKKFREAAIPTRVDR